MTVLTETTCARCTMSGGVMAPDIMGVITHITADDCIAAVEEDRQRYATRVAAMEREREMIRKDVALLREWVRTATGSWATVEQELAGTDPAVVQREKDVADAILNRIIALAAVTGGQG